MSSSNRFFRFFTNFFKPQTWSVPGGTSRSDPIFKTSVPAAAPPITNHPSSFFFIFVTQYARGSSRFGSWLFTIWLKCLCLVYSYGGGVFASSFSRVHNLICSSSDWVVGQSLLLFLGPPELGEPPVFHPVFWQNVYSGCPDRMACWFKSDTLNWTVRSAFNNHGNSYLLMINKLTLTKCAQNW